MTTFDSISAKTWGDIGKDMVGCWARLALALHPVRNPDAYNYNSVVCKSYQYGKSNDYTCAQALMKMVWDNAHPIADMVRALNEIDMQRINEKYGLPLYLISFSNIDPATRGKIGVKMTSDWRQLAANLYPSIDHDIIRGSMHLSRHNDPGYSQELMRQLSESSRSLGDIVRALREIHHNLSVKILLRNLPRTQVPMLVVPVTITTPPAQVVVIQAPTPAPTLLSRIKDNLGDTSANTFVNVQRGYDVKLRDREAERVDREKILRAALAQCREDRTEDQAILQKKKEDLRAHYEKKIEDAQRIKGQEAAADLDSEMKDAPKKTKEEEEKEFKDSVGRTLEAITKSKPNLGW